MALLSPFALNYQVTAQVTTQLDENGLIAPHVTVTDGIELNGSKITGLAAGTEATDAVNRAQLDAEAGTRAQADAQLAGAIVTEAQVRAQELFQANQRIDDESAGREALAASLLNETSARMVADQALSDRIDAVGDRLDTLSSRVDRVERRATSGTAVAVALGGAAFLPDTRFNLTANVATYAGAHAGAMQMGALVSRHVAVNAGVASGFNRGGRTAARAGFTVGW